MSINFVLGMHFLNFLCKNIDKYCQILTNNNGLYIIARTTRKFVFVVRDQIDIDVTLEYDIEQLYAFPFVFTVKIDIYIRR